MGTKAPTTLVIPLRCAPKKAPCPNCGKPGLRKRIRTRRVRTVAYRAVAFLEVTYGEYAARCGCCTTFRNSPAGVPPKAHYDNAVRQLVRDRVLKDGMSIARTLASIRREFLLELSSGFVYDVLRDHAAALDMAAHRRMVLEHFSGTLCVDELHLGRFILLLATDPLADLPVAFALVARNDQGHMRRFLGNLKTWGLRPRIVVSDGSPLYPALVAEVWPAAAHQLCVFHALKEIHTRVLDAVRRLRTALARRDRARHRHQRGRKSRQAKVAARRGPAAREKAAFIWRHRYLIVSRRADLTAAQRDDLATMLGYLPELAVLRRFVDRISWLFDTPQDGLQARCRRSVLLRDPAFRAIPELVQALGQLDEPRFGKLMAFLASPVGRRVRTNNHVERTNRLLRFLEKVRYKWRRRRMLVRFLVLKLDTIWSHWAAPETGRTDRLRSGRCCKAQPHDQQGS